MKGSKMLKRIAAVGLAAIMVLGSVNLSGIDVSAETENGKRTPYYNYETHKYEYASGDILGAATHVHLFGRTVISNAHTHGNIFCQIGQLGENGTRTENNDTTEDGVGSKFDSSSWYHEVNYIQNRLECINAASSLDVLVVGTEIGHGENNSGKWIETTLGQTALNKTNYIYQDMDGVTAINFDDEFALLRQRSEEWSKMPTSPNISYDITTDMNNRYINVNGRNVTDNVYLNISYNDWRWGGNGNQITIYGLDGTTTNKGVLIINIDMAGVTNPDFSLSGAGLKVSTNNGDFNNREFQTSEFGSYRILFNLYNSQESDHIYRGNATFSNVLCGSILAPEASVTVGAVNGTVAAKEIIHIGQESHRMDLWALDTVGDGENPYVEFSLNKQYEGISGKVDESLLAATSFGLYSDAACTSRLAVAYPYNNGEEGAKVTFSRAIKDLNVGENVFYIKEISAPWGYVVSETVYRCVITCEKNGEKLTVSSVKYGDGETGLMEVSPTCVNRRTTTDMNNNVVLSLIKIYRPLPANESERNQFLQNTKFGLYSSIEDAIAGGNNGTWTSPEYKNGNQAVVSFTISQNELSFDGESKVYYMRETTAPDELGYKINTTIYACKITLSDDGYFVTYAECTNNNEPADGAYTSDFPQCVNVKEGTETTIIPQSVEVTFELQKTFSGFNNLSEERRTQVINNTTFALFQDRGCTIEVGSFSSNGSTGDNVITYQCTRNFTGLNTTPQYFYIKETKTDGAYTVSKKVYEVKICYDERGVLQITYATYKDENGNTILSSQNHTSVLPTFENVLDESKETGTKPGTGTEQEPGTEPEPGTGTEQEPGTEPEPGTGTEQEPDPKPEPGTGTEQEPDPKPEPGTTEQEPGTEQEPETTESGTDSVPENSNQGTTDNSNTSTPPPTGSTTTPSTPTNSTPTSSTPSTPTTPSTPSVPLTPNTPTTPTSSTPSTPSAPQTPDTPNSWVTPDGKVHYEILIEYEHIDSSSTQERIEELITNTTIKITDQNGNDVTEHVTKITWDPSRNVAIVTVEAPKPSEGFDTYYVVEDTDPADNELSHSEPGRGFTVAITSDGRVLFQEDGSAAPTTEMRFVNVETDSATSFNGGGGSQTMTSMTSAQTGERKLPWAVFGGGMSMIFIAGTVYVFKKKEKIER